MWLFNLITGGFLKGQRTYILGMLIIVQALVGWAVGDVTTAEFFSKVPEMLAGAGLMTLRAGVNNSS